MRLAPSTTFVPPFLDGHHQQCWNWHWVSCECKIWHSVPILSAYINWPSHLSALQLPYNMQPQHWQPTPTTTCCHNGRLLLCNPAELLIHPPAYLNLNLSYSLDCHHLPDLFTLHSLQLLLNQFLDQRYPANCCIYSIPDTPNYIISLSEHTKTKEQIHSQIVAGLQLNSRKEIVYIDKELTLVYSGDSERIVRLSYKEVNYSLYT